MKKKRFLGLLVAIFFMMQIVLPGIITEAVALDITGLFQFITDVKITDVNGKDLGNNIRKNSEIHINYTWSIPNDQTVNPGDYYTMQLPGQIKIATAVDMLMTNPADGETVAYIHIDTNGKVKITFTAYPSQHSDVHGGFTLDCHFNEGQIGNVNPVTIDFTVPGTGVVHVGSFNFQQPDPTITKSGAYNSTTDEITWTITVNKEAVGLDNTSVVDTINSGQVLVDNSVQINSTPAVLGTNYSYDNASRKLTVSLSRITSQQVITYKTSVHNDLASKSQGTYNYTNTAALNCDINGTPKKFTSNTVTIPVTVKYISKTGTYDSANKRINWTIKVNESLRTINNAVVSDTIPQGLTIDKTTIQVGGVAAAEGTDYTVSGQNFTCNLGNISTLKTITFSTNVDSSVYNSNTYKSYNNTAVLSGDGVLAGTSASKSVGFTPNIISKKGVSYDASTGIITWKITVNTNKTNVAAGAQATDIIPIGQAYIAGSAQFDGNAIDDSGYTAAPGGDASKTGTFVYTFSGSFSDTHTITYKTQVTDPKVYKANYSGNFTNSVTLMSPDINQKVTANQAVSSEVISKTAAGYNYASREITWKIKVNKNKMPITNAVVTDDIPAGQVYVDNSASIDNSAPAGGFSYNAVTGDPSKTGTLTYTFPTGSGNTINSTYTITFKTRVTDLSIFNTNGTKNLSNTASITGDEIPSDGNRSSTATQAVSNTVVNKTPTYTYGNSYIDWTLNINSNFNIDMNEATITDTLQEGLSLNTDTVELYEATVNSDGTLTAGTKVTLTAENVKYDPDTREFDFTFPETAETKAYILKFTTDASKAGDYSNTVEFKGGAADQTSSGTQNGVWYASGSAWGTGVTGSITVVKVDNNNTSSKLAGAVFQLLDQYGNIKATSAPTGSDGSAVFKYLKYDINYTIKEITPPVGYVLSSEAYTFQIHNATGQKDITYTYKDTKIKGNIQFTKTGSDGKGIKGAEFTLYKEDAVTPVLDAEGKNITATSDQDGKVQFSDIEYGNYNIKETKAAEGYVLSAVTVTAAFSGDYQNTVITVTPTSVLNVEITGGIKITKKDASTGAPVPGATITVYKSDGTPVGSGVEGVTKEEDGTVEFDNLNYGDYYFLETNAPEGYLLNTDKHSFSIRENGVILQDTLSDTMITGGIKIKKTDASTGAPVPGATITVYNSDGTPVGSGVEGVTKEEDGTVEFDNLNYGDYYFLETNAPEGYLLNTDKHPFSIRENGVILQDTLSDTMITGGIKITKKDASTGAPVPGATITVYKSDGTPVGSGVEGVTKEEDGTVEFDNLNYGDYYFLETNAPEGYLLNTDKHPFSIRENGVILQDTLSDTMITGGIKITKKDASTGAPVPGATITVYKSDGTPVGSGVEGVTKEEDGTVEFDNLNYGDYYFLETNAPEGYLLNTDKHPFSIRENGVILQDTLSDTMITGGIKITKKDASTGAPVPGATITVYNSDGTPVGSGVEGVTKEEDGTVEFDNLNYGDYYFLETNAPEGYLLNTDKHPFSIRENGVILQDTLSDTMITGGIKITKKDASTGAPVPGATITVYKSDGTPVGSGVEGVTKEEDGTVEFHNLNYGDYYFLETNAPEGYLLNTDKHSFSIRENGVILQDTLSDEKIKGSIQIKKTDNNGKLLKGAEFTLYDESGKALQSEVSDENGIALFKDMVYGKYSVKETKAPEGYTASNDTIEVSVEENGYIYSYEVENTIIKGTVEIKKPDNDSNAVKEEVASSETQSATSQAQSGILSLPKTGGFMNTTLLIIAGLISIITGIALTLMKKTKH